MQTLRIVNVQIVSNVSLSVTFTENLTPNLVTSNVSIISDTAGTPDSTVQKVSINGATLTITCQPLIPLSSYFLQFQSTSANPFISLNGDAKIVQDGVSNQYLIIGPIEPDNAVKSYFLNYYKGNIYDLNNDQTVVSKYIDALSTTLSRALHDIDQVKNENYLSFTVTDEQQTRGQGPFDRLNEECAYEVIRVGLTPTDATNSLTVSQLNFPAYPITLQAQDNTEILTVNSIDSPGFFNINTFTLNLSNNPVTRVDSIIFTLLTNNPNYVYNIPIYGYQILDSRYDQDYASTYLSLQNNQIRLSEQILSDPNFSLNSILNIQVQYETKNLGRVIDSSTVTVTTVATSIRETIPPIINIFNLDYAPITDSSGNIETFGGVTFTDPNNLVPGALHPAFTVELPFRLSALPFSPGQYSIDYATGTVYVYGQNTQNDGTGPYPPLATYNYLFTYKSEQDYVYDSDLLDIVALPVGNLINNQGNINFNYEQVLIPGVDYNADLHIEALTEYVGNSLAASNVIIAQNSPITNVFQILNETSGEIYTLDRWYNNYIYFRYNVPPRILQKVRERASFQLITNELLFVNTVLTNNFAIKIFKIFLNNNSLVAATEDSLGTSFNSSAVFSNSMIFVNEIWFNRQLDENTNINRLNIPGLYMIDYTNGIVYCAVVNSNNTSIGTISYKASVIIPQFPHIISVDNLYYQITVLEPPNKTFTFIRFEDGSITPATLDYSDELSLNNSTSIYQLVNGQIGIFVSSGFLPGVTNQVEYVRSVFEYNDLLNSVYPLNFASVSTGNLFNIQVGSLTGQMFENIQFDGTNYYVLINQNIPYLSPDISYVFNIVRVSDSAIMWNSSGTIIPGSTLKLILPGINSPHIGDLVNVTYTYTIVNSSRVVTDYNRGDYFLDYTYIADELVISYEYGDNVLDFSQGTALSAGDTYYVSYKAGALRDALERNFGNLVNIPQLTNFDIQFNRERYRDALTAALTSFIQGPTLSAIKNVGQTISHIEPVITEAAFQNWSLGSSLLNPEPVSTTGTLQLVPSKYDDGILINEPGQTITFPVSSNIRLEEGTFETWVSPSWNGLDNDAILTFSILQDGYIIDPSKIFIGAGEHHPELLEGLFTLKKSFYVSGVPNVNKNGIFIYYDEDISGNFSRWYLRIIDGYVSSTYKFKITSNGSFYNNKSINFPKPSNMTIFTGTNSINFTVTVNNSPINEGITFISDVEHFILDFAEDKSKSRLSIFKDVSGYLNFKVYDKNRTSYTLSTDISNWQAGQLHFVAASWMLNTRNNRDEMHLFLDGFEVPNIIKYGQKLQPYLHEKFRTVDPEEIIGSVNRDTLGSDDLQTIAGSNIVSSTINFSAYNIFVGDTIFINEVGFSNYTIININGQQLTLSAVMPATLTNGRYSINQQSFVVQSDIDIAPNIIVTTIHDLVSGNDINGISGSNLITSTSINFTNIKVLPGYSISIENSSLESLYTILQVNNNTLMIDDCLPINIVNNTFRIYSNTENELPGVRAISPDYSISQDSNYNNILTISNDLFAGDLILIRTLGLNHRTVKQQYYVWSNNIENMLKTNLPAPISLNEVNITKIILQNTSIGINNSTLSGNLFTSNNLTVYQPINSKNGRTLSVTISGNNTNFSTPVQVNINGNVSETLIFNNYGTLNSVNLYSSINYINVIAQAISVNKNVLNIAIQEAYSMTEGEMDGYAPVIRYSYPVNSGLFLFQNGSNAVTDNDNLFSSAYVGNYLLIAAPANVAGQYIITGVSSDRHTLYLGSNINNFNNGVYQILNSTSYRSGLQNGFFTFEIGPNPGTPYLLTNGFYQIDYSTYMKVKIDPLNTNVFLGSDFLGGHQLNGVLSDVKIYSVMLTDTRIGESIPANQQSITKDFNSLKPLTADSNTLMLLPFNSLPITNNANFIINTGGVDNFFASSLVVNENFNNSLVILNEPLIIPNNGILDTRKQATIEFWLNPLFDTGNDPQKRYYFDAFGAITENVVSVNRTAIKVSAPIGKVLSVKLQAGDSRIDYFAGGKIAIDTQNAILEEGFSINNSTVVVSKPILQVISVTIIGDLTNTDYFAGGSIGTNGKTIYLGKSLPGNDLPLMITYQSTNNNNQTLNTQVIYLNRELPYENTPVIVNYVPKGLQGDRISIFKDEIGNMNFSIFASNIDYTIQAPIVWSKNTWHRVKASYKINTGPYIDEMRLFIDGYQHDQILSFGFPIASDGYIFAGPIKFKDQINQILIGTQFDGKYPIFSLFDNLRISNISRPIYAPYGEPIDVNYSTNLSMNFPVTSDLYTTYLLNEKLTSAINTNFATIKNRVTGLFDFSVNIIDSLGIVSSNIKSQEALETIINILKPANSRVFISYTE